MNILNNILNPMKNAQNHKGEIVDMNSDIMNMVDKYDEDSMYVLEEIPSTDDDYKLIKKCFTEKTYNLIMYSYYETLTMKIYRVNKRSSAETTNQKSDNLMLFHGTTHDNAVGILEKGFKPSTKGLHGPGVYMTASSGRARVFSRRNIFDLFKRKESTVVVNEIVESETLEEVVPKRFYFSILVLSLATTIGPYFFDNFVLLLIIFVGISISNKHKCPRRNRFERYIYGIAGKNVDGNFEKDSNGRKIKISNVGIKDWTNDYVCDEKMVIPRYLIQYHSKYQWGRYTGAVDE